MLFLELNRSGCKTYLLGCEETQKSILIDPVKERVDRCLSVLAYHRLALELVIDTHTHADHRSGVWDLRELTGAKVVMHKRAPAPHIDLHVAEGDQLEVGRLRLGFIHTPGHAPDGVCVRVADMLFTGDTLLVRSTGRTDFPGGDAGEQYDAITRKLFTLPDEIRVFPAHDYRGNVCSTIGEEKRSNPRIAGRSREAYIALMNNLGMPLPDKIQEALQANVSAIDDDSVKFPSYAQLTQARQLTPQDLHQRLSAGIPPVLLDVREPDEFIGELGHIAGSVLTPLRHLSERAQELEAYRERELVAICRAGVRSATAPAMLTGLGFEHVFNLKGGILDWIEAGFPVERTTP